MTSPPDPPRHFYTDLVGEALDDYSRNQLEDTREGLHETLRLWKEMYSAVDGETKHQSKWLEWWSAAAHYSAASAANFGVLMSALGAPRQYGTSDGLRPVRHMSLPNATKPRCVGFRRLGASEPMNGKEVYASLDPNLVTFNQEPSQVGSDVWKVRFDLSSDATRGTYFVRIAPGGGLGRIIELHQYLDPTA